MPEEPGTPVGLRADRAKHEILEDLGQASLVLPTLVNRGLEANDRAKYLLSLLQAARDHADRPDRPYSSLSRERLAAGISDERLDGVVAGSGSCGDGAYLVPRAGRLHEELVTAITDMLAPLKVDGARLGELGERLRTLLSRVPDLGTDCIPGAYLDGMTSADRQAGDSLHLLIMDAHRALNQLQTEVATEILDGAAVYCLQEGDRSLVSAFMAGVRATQALKFGHPGLGTTATRAGGRLLIQNDIGLTNAHVVVVTVEGLACTVTYSDVHLDRLNFLKSTLDGFPVQWSDAEYHPGTADLDEHHLVTGRYESPDRNSLRAFLSHLGSRLVFLIDWNRARKRLGSLVKRREAIALLRWAADEELGHMAFLLMGGQRLVYDAIELTGRAPARYGEPLRDVLGTDATLDILRFAIRAASEGMRSGKSQLLIRDELRVELMRHVQAADRQLLDGAAEHGSLVVETAQAFHAALVHLGMTDGTGFVRRAAGRAGIWEHRADQILSAIRLLAHRIDGADAMVGTVSALDGAMDSLEEALFLLTLLPTEARATVRPVLGPLAGIAVSATREHLKAIEIAKELVVAAGDDELEDFLVAIDHVAVLEHEADGAERTARAMLVTEAPDFRTLHVADGISCAVESATDALLHSSLLLRDHVLGHGISR